MATVYLARHCRTRWNEEGRLQGTVDLPLSEDGRKEAANKGLAMKGLGIDRVVSSDAARAFQTAGIYACILAVRRHARRGLRELDHGLWEGRTTMELMADPGAGYAEWLRDPGSVPIPGSREDAATAQKRIVKTIQGALRQFPGETLLIVTHKHIMALLMCAVEGVSMNQFSAMIREDTDPRLVREDRLANL